MASNTVRGFSFFQLLVLILIIFSSLLLPTTGKGKEFSIEEATVYDLQHALQKNQITSKQLVEFYIKQIKIQNPVLRGVLELNPEAVAEAERADRERREKAQGSVSALHGIPILLKDNIATKDKMNTTAGSFALLGSVVPRDAAVVTRLRKAGAIILGKATLSEWSNYRSSRSSSGWNARGGQGKSPYTLGTPCGSSSGPAISVAANLVAVSLGTETDGSILCPSETNSVVGIKPTVGLTSRAGVVPISLRQDSVGPICRTVSDAALVLGTIAGIDNNDKATIEASKYIPKGGYAQFLKKDGLRGKRLGVVRSFYGFGNDTFLDETFKLHLKTIRQRGAVLVDNLEINNINEIDSGLSEGIALAFEFKSSLNAYLKGLIASPVRSLADVIAFNNKYPKLEKLAEYGQDLMLQAQSTSGIKTLNQALSNLTRLSQNGFEKLMAPARGGRRMAASFLQCPFPVNLKGSNNGTAIIGGLRIRCSLSVNTKTEPEPVLRLAKAFAPATVANLGPGFDFLGCAVDGVGDTVSVRVDSEVKPGELRITDISGHAANKLSKNPLWNCAGIAAIEVMKMLGIRTLGLSLSLEKGLPLGSGLGSSAASAAAAAVAVNELFGNRLGIEELVLASLKSEEKVAGYHADNVAPSIMGGFVLIRSYEPLELIQLKLPIEKELFFVLVTPEFEAPTKKMRAALPGEIGMAQHVWNCSQAGALVAAVLHGDLVELGKALSSDKIFEPRRAPLIPGMEAVKNAAIHAGAFGCTISGSGPTAVAIIDDEQKGHVIGQHMIHAFLKDGNLKASAKVTQLDRLGARRI